MLATIVAQCMPGARFSEFESSFGVAFAKRMYVSLCAHAFMSHMCATARRSVRACARGILNRLLASWGQGPWAHVSKE